MAKKTSPPFDILAAIAEQLAACDITLESLSRVDAAPVLEGISRDLARELLQAPADQRGALRTVAFAGFLAALGRGVQLGALAAKERESQMLEVAGAAYEAGELDPEAWGFILGLLKPGRNLVVLDDTLVH
jgi:hypothetical protein